MGTKLPSGLVEALLLSESFGKMGIQTVSLPRLHGHDHKCLEGTDHVNFRVLLPTGASQASGEEGRLLSPVACSRAVPAVVRLWPQGWSPSGCESRFSPSEDLEA